MTVREQRREILHRLDENPSLKPYPEKAIKYAHESSLDLVVLETPLDDQDLPKDRIYTIEQLLNPDFPSGLNEV